MIEDNTILCKRDDETDFQYHKRLVYGKLEDKTLADYDYTELSKYVYGKEFAGDVARRLMYGSKRTLDLLEHERIENVSDDSLLFDLDSKMRDLRKEKQKFFDQRREFNKVLMEQARWEHIEDMLRDAAASPELRNMKIMPSDYGRDCDDTEAILVFSDWHYGMVANNIFNTYNTDICKRRVTQIVSSAIERIKLHKCAKLNIFLLGDFIHGALRASARVASEEYTIDQLMSASEIVAQAIYELAGYVDEVYVYSTYGNHARVVPEKKDSIHCDNMERIIPWWLKCRLSECQNVTVVPGEDTEFIFANVCGYDVCASHGDLDAVRNSPRLLTTLMHKTYGKDIDCIILGDKHHRESFDELGVTAMLCGALCGTDDYANGKRLYSTPSQLLLIYNDSGLDAEYRLKCE